MIASREITGVDEHFLECLVESVQLVVADRDQNTVFEDEVHRLHLKIGFKEVTVCYDAVVRLDITGRELDLFHFFIFLNINLQESLQGILRLVTHVQQVNPDYIFLVQLFERRDSTGYLDFILVFIEYLDF